MYKMRNQNVSESQKQTRIIFYKIKLKMKRSHTDTVDLNHVGSFVVPLYIVNCTLFKDYV